MSKQLIFPFIEFFILCIVLPTFIWTTNSGGMMFGFLWGAMVYTCFIWWRLNKTSHPELVSGSDARDSGLRQNDALGAFKTEWNWGAMTAQNLKPVLTRWVIGTVLICLFTWWYSPDRLFHIPLNMPQIIPFLILAYPLLSALPQEFIFCSFFMKRYGHWFKADWMKILISAIVFGYAHMLFLNWVAPVLSFFGGLVFAYTYLKTRSLALVTFEHSLYGNSIFLAGIGYYFYSGGIGQ